MTVLTAWQSRRDEGHKGWTVEKQHFCFWRRGRVQTGSRLFSMMWPRSSCLLVRSTAALRHLQRATGWVWCKVEVKVKVTLRSLAVISNVKKKLLKVKEEYCAGTPSWALSRSSVTKINSFNLSVCVCFVFRGRWYRPAQTTRYICGTSVRGVLPSCTRLSSTERGEQLHSAMM